MFSWYDVSLKSKTVLRIHLSQASFRRGIRRLAIGGSDTVFPSIALGECAGIIYKTYRMVVLWYPIHRYTYCQIVHGGLPAVTVKNKWQNKR